MDIFLKTAAVVLVTIILGLTLSKQTKDITVLLVIAACCFVLTAAMAYLKPVVDFVHTLESMGNLNTALLTSLLKAVGIALLAEVTSLICSDSGFGALGKSIHILGTGVIIWICIPLFHELLDLIEKILGGI